MGHTRLTRGSHVAHTRLTRGSHSVRRCAAENVIYSVDEPEVCKYTMRFETPLACMEEHAAAARQEVELLRVPNHDEL